MYLDLRWSFSANLHNSFKFLTISFNKKILLLPKALNTPLLFIIQNTQTIEFLKTCVRHLHQIFIFSPNDSPSKTRKNAFYFIKKALFVLEIISCFYFRPSLFFSLPAIELEDDRR